MVLIDEGLLDYKPILQHYQTKQDLTWTAPAIPKDAKAKHCGQNLRRFLQTERKLNETDLGKMVLAMDE